MWFRNLTLYTIDLSPLSAEAFIKGLMSRPFHECDPHREASSGFVPLLANSPELFTLSIGGDILFSMRTDKKLVPGDTKKKAVAAAIEEFHSRNGRYPSRIERRDLKEDAINALFPLAFAVESRTRAWINRGAGLLVIDTASKKEAERLVLALIRTLKVDLKVRPLATNWKPSDAMTHWVNEGEGPFGFTVDTDTVFSTNNGSGHVKYENTELCAEEINRHAHLGNHVLSLAMTGPGKVSFALMSDGSLRRVSALDVLMQAKHEDLTSLSGDFLLMSATFLRILEALFDSLDGIKLEESPMPDVGGAEIQDDDMYPQARALVIKEQRASTSLVQRHLRIGYNRAARLMNELEERHVVSVQNEHGNRTVLVEAAHESA